MRRLPIYLVLDISESMLGEPIECLERGMLDLLKNLRSDPYALESAFLSVIAFAGRVETLTPLTEVYLFQPPNLSLGAGTNIGAAIEHLINEIKNNVRTNTPQEKGDFMPIVYFLSDGKATDNPQKAIKKYQKEIGSKAKFIAVGLGKNADLSIFRPISEEILRLTNTSAVDFKKFIDWVSQSITAQSQSVGACKSIDKISLEKAQHNEAMEIVEKDEDFLAQEENFLIFQAHCSQTKKIYLLKYERNDDNQVDVPTGFFSRKKSATYDFVLTAKAPEDYEYWSGKAGLDKEINISVLNGFADACPHCGNSHTMGLCSCGKLMCHRDVGVECKCPNCNRTVVFQVSDDFEINKSRG